MDAESLDGPDIEDGDGLNMEDGDGPMNSTGQGVMSRVGLNDNKAGMQGLDKEKINKIILENSIGSKFYESERKKDAQVDLRIQKLLAQVDKITPSQKDAALGQTNKILDDLEKGRDLSRCIVHIDMDAFYAAVEERDNPDLKHKPMAVGGMGMLSTSNYLARRYGVRAAMPGFIGKKLCPDLVLVPTNFAKYTEVSHQIREVIACYDPDFSPMSLDEAYLDITPYLDKRKLMPESERTFVSNSESEEDAPSEKIVFGVSAEEVVKEIRFRIHQRTQLTASAGIAPNALLAKVVSDMNKPNGQFYLEPTRECVMDFIRKLPIRKVGGIGKVSEKLLNAIGVQTCQDLHDERAVLFLAFSQTMSSYLLRVSLGLGATSFDNDSERKSISTERTFKDISNPKEMFRKCEELCEALEADAKKENIRGLTVTLKIKTASFELHTRSKTLHHTVAAKSETYPVIADLLRQELASRNHQLKLRLIGVGLSKLTKNAKESQQRSIDYFVQKVGGTTTKQPLPMNDVQDDTPEDPCDVPADVDELSVANSEPKSPHHDNNKSSSDTEVPVDIDTVEDWVQSTSTDFACPMCGLQFDSVNTLNSHVDKCFPSNVEREKGAVTPPSKHDNNNEVCIGEQISCMTCPLCNATFCCQDISLKKFNSHVDSCLNRKTILEIVKTDSANRRENDLRRKNTDAVSAPPKKRKKILKTQSQTLDRYFK